MNFTGMAFVQKQIGSNKTIVGSSQECQTCARLVYTYSLMKMVFTLSVEAILLSFFILSYATMPSFLNIE